MSDKLLAKKINLMDLPRVGNDFKIISAAVSKDTKERLDCLKREHNIRPSVLVRILLEEFFEGLES